MENDLEYIEHYFSKGMSEGEVRQFEQLILDDPAFAESVAFYLSARQAAKEEGAEERKREFLEIYRTAKVSTPVRKIGRSGWYLAAAAVFVVLITGWYLLQSPVAPEKLANRYIDQHWGTLGVSMSSKQDSIQKGLLLYNEGKWKEAQEQFDLIIRSGSAGPDVKKYAGIVALRLKDYDKALTYFKQLADYNLYANPGLFYQAMTLMERNQSGDPEKAKQILQQVVQNDLEEKETAREWLKKL